MDDKQIEQEIQTKGLTAPRVTMEDIEANIVEEVYFTAADGADGAEMNRGGNPVGVASNLSLHLLTFCVLVLRNGFTVTGESACASPENFDAELGRKIARQNAINKVWRAMGYALKERLAQGCGKCGQADKGQTGEYPCSDCGLPMVHDAPLPEASPSTKAICNDERACGACWSDQGACENASLRDRLLVLADAFEAETISEAWLMQEMRKLAEQF